MGSQKTSIIYGLIGRPLSHSFSKQFFFDKFKKEKIDANYQNFELNSISEILDLIKKNRLKGLNVTIPYKTAVIPYLDIIAEDAYRMQAVNTIKFVDGKLIGYNTDCIGFEKTLKPLLKPYHNSALILGTGGASKAVKYVLNKLKIESTFVSRTKSQKNQFYLYEQIDRKILEANQIIINTTPVGTFPNVNDKPKLPYHFIKSTHLLYDLIYNPETTAFLKEGLEQSCTTKNGYAMLVEQALASWEIWND